MKRFQRTPKNLPYRRNVFILTEGEETEEAYLRIVERRFNLKEAVQLVFPCHESAIQALLDGANKVVKRKDYHARYGDEIWIVLDRDEKDHFIPQFKKLGKWEKESTNFHVALSTPRFEYWLLLHFMEHPTKANALSDSFVEKLLPRFKHLPIGTPTITRENILKAIERASRREIPTCSTPDVLGTGMGVLLKSLPGIAQQ